jgi:hypothetical protein
MLPTPIIILISIVALILLTVVVYVSTGSIISVLVVISLIVILGAVLQKLGILKMSFANGGLDISFMEQAPAPAPAATKQIMKTPIEKKEVFYVAGNDYTYEDAPAVCAAYEADLATYDQVSEAYSAGAEWCGYGWSVGGMALFPTQQATWEALQMEVSVPNKTSCGRPGVNGGYFDPNTKFGVNCYGVKPSNVGVKFPTPLPGTSGPDFQKLVDKFRSMLKKMTVNPFNRDGWSEWNVSAHV